MNISTRLPSLRAALAAAVILSVAGRAAAVDPAAGAASAPASEALRAHIVEMIGDAACDGQGQCHVAGLGRRPCGGPESWLPWSTKTTDSRALQDAVVELAKARIGENKAAGLLSDCQVRPDPSAVCRPRAGDGKKTCQLGQGGIASPI
ncbi:hypothetical protein [Scleromatobacter humisilvae]|uniref:Uncharacterized protein n=1 Tax=Scleromatobacter humisilvae TaxID=2897159 RepID=A0A9X1YH54_9BURK|nr:hypothetical protein [Scleromatobacter humisilvae]MCK9684760.1 hypothetical protein [Scleromatobacter humisilvae]